VSSVIPKKALGQHWLYDQDSLKAMAEAAEVSEGDTLLEVGPGLGTLTEVLLNYGANVVAVEFDDDLAIELEHKYRNLSSSGLTRESSKKLDSRLRGNDDMGGLQIVNEDILKFDFSSLPKGYKVAANIPYYLTSNLIRRLLEAENKPSVIVLLIQKEVAERIVATPGDMSILAVSVQFYAKASLKDVVPAKLFTPPPKVDSQIIKIKLRDKPLFSDVDTEEFFKIVKAGFSEKRKKLRSSLSGGLHISKTESDNLIKKAQISSDARAQELTLEEWYNLYLAYKN
jgi:16S rRNA (adenine1518-N6/adenine1519-N6)-dimethyltransferase